MHTNGPLFYSSHCSGKFQVEKIADQNSNVQGGEKLDEEKGKVNEQSNKKHDAEGEERNKGHNDEKDKHEEMDGEIISPAVYVNPFCCETSNNDMLERVDAIQR